MPDLFTLGDQIHHANDQGCPACAEGYPEGCSCGGLIHAAEGVTDADADIALATQCDRCHRSKGDLDEQVA